MLICHCEAVNDASVKTAIDGGARTVDDITDACDAGGDCSGCHKRLQALIDVHAPTDTALLVG